MNDKQNGWFDSPEKEQEVPANIPRDAGQKQSAQNVSDPEKHNTQQSIAGEGFVMRESTPVSQETPPSSQSAIPSTSSQESIGEPGFYQAAPVRESTGQWQTPPTDSSGSSHWGGAASGHPNPYPSQRPYSNNPYDHSPSSYGAYAGYASTSAWHARERDAASSPGPVDIGSGGWKSDNKKERPTGEKTKKKGTGLKIFGVLLGSAAAIGLFALAGVGLYSILTPNPVLSENANSSSSSTPTTAELMPGITLEDVPQTTTASSPSASGKVPEGGYSTEALVEMVSPSVVAISSYDNTATLQATGIGSGIIIREDGYIVTNDHVVETAQSLTVTLSNEKVYEGRVIATDSKTDLAVIKIDATDLPAAVFGNSDQVRIGERVIAIGNPQSMQFYGSVTQGIVSGLGRSVTAASPSGGTSTNYSNLIQTDAAINPGNSGGALVNAYGQIIGINSAKVITSGSEGMGFAIPSNEVKEIVDDLINYKRVLGRVRLGITARAIDEVTAQRNNVPVGIYVVSTEEGSDISKKGVLPGDIITAVDGENVTSFNQLNASLEGKNPGDTVTLSIYRRSELYPGEGKRMEFTVSLMEDMGETQETTQTTPEQQIPENDYHNQYPYYDLEDFLREYFGQ